MKISELSVESGASVPTIKFYLREGLLPPGTLSAPNQAEYGPEHVRRLRLVRALADLGDLPIATIRHVLDAIDDEKLSLHDVLGVAHYALGRRLHASLPAAELADSRHDVDHFIDEDLSWVVKPDAPGRDELADSLATLRSLGWRVDARVFSRYARLADRLAAWEVRQTPAGADRERTVESAVVGTVVFEVVLDALRRLAQEHHSAKRHAGR